MADKVKLKIVRGTNQEIELLNDKKEDGTLYFAYDTGKIFLDNKVIENNEPTVKRFLMSAAASGEGAAGYVYSEGTLEENLIKLDPGKTNREDPYYYLYRNAFSDKILSLPDPDTLVINSNGWFFRVIEVETDRVLVKIISAGTASGGESSEDSRDLELKTSGFGDGSTYILGHDYELKIIGTAKYDDTVHLYIYIKDEEHDIVISDGQEKIPWPSGQEYILHTNKFPETSNLTIQVKLSSENTLMVASQRPSKTYTASKVVKMELEKVKTNNSGYYPIKTSNEVNQSFQVSYIPVGDSSLVTTLHVFIDNVEYPSLNQTLQTTGASNPYNNTNVITIPKQSHGSHTVKLQLGLNVSNSEIFSNELVYELAWAEADNNEPIIWLGDYDSTIINYENSYIQYMVYDPIKGKDLAADVSLYKEGIMLKEFSVEYSVDSWAEIDISDIYELGENKFTIVCRGVSKEVTCYVTNEGARDLSIKPAEALLINYSASGRSNLEAKEKRSIWGNTISTNDFAVLSGFNWKSNGWKKDTVSAGETDNGTYLSLTNGASVSIPCPQITLNNESDYTIEIRFRIKNVQKYSTLIQNEPVYFYEDDVYNQVGSNAEYDPSINYYTKRENVEIYDKAIISEFDPNVTYYTRTSLGQAQTTATKAWIDANNKVFIYDEYGSPKMDEKNINKTYSTTEGVVCKWLENNTYGLCLGSQEAYFRSSRGSVNVRYKEDEVINISIVVSKTDGLVYIYLNGILSGADALPQAGVGKVTINDPFVFNSDYCDVDLYRFRIFQWGLTMPEVIHNYLSDIHNITLYDQNQLTTAQDPTQISYPLLLEYNKNHPEALTMPYATWKIISRQDEKLPWKKGDNQMCVVTFVNPSLDQALDNHEIDEWYYYTHCPSFEATGVDINVQGTSSQGYPRRNYKTKFKSAAASEKNPTYGWKYTKGSLAGKVVNKAYTITDKDGVEHTLSKNFHMDNYGLGTNKFTWKIDYMESSGTYNTGFANLMGNGKYPLYTKHPLDDLGLDGSNMRSTVYGFPILVFHEYETASNNPSNPSVKYEYIGRYNMNLDKGSNEYYGFESSDVQPYLTYQKVKTDEEGNPLLDENDEPIMEDYHPKIKDIAECWELEDNQGTWCSFKYPSAAAREQGFGTKQGTVSPESERLEMFRHFEYRYSPYADQLDAIGADGKYDGTVPADKPEIAEEIGPDDTSKSEYARRVYSNLEVLFNWLDSTDATSATNAELSGPITYRTKVQYMICLVQTNEVDSQGNYVTEQWYCDINNTPIVKTNDANITTDANGYNIYLQNGVNLLEQSIAADDYPGLTLTKNGVQVTYTHDTAAYRLDKFRNEFDKHLDKEYCLVYFVLTELLLCYDSRGKNMMLSSYGPREAGGDYIWYPMFYDIDTQLGLNNSGAYLWDYDADVTEDGLFSTPSSVLWVNLYHIFNEEIKNKYRVLRGLDDSSSVHGSLTYDNIAGAYECNPKVFDSYAMQGIRPIIAIGLDEYYKYFATTKTGYFDTSGTKIIEDVPQYAYACQGDKKLTTELLLRNRLNYIDSWWLGGNYDISAVKQGQFWGRVNGNRRDKTSDKFLNLSQSEIDTLKLSDPKYNGFTHADYPKPYFDAQPGFQLKPFLKQYVSYFTDENPSIPEKYTASTAQVNGVHTNDSESVIATYKTTAEMPNEQLVYIPGVDYLSSLGDLSTSYFSEFTLTAGKRLLDLTLGSDIPGYENSLIDADKKFDIADGATSSTKKSLLKKVVMTGMKTFDKTLDVAGSEKLQEFRALNTLLPNVYFADGSPLHTVHLPSSLQTLKLVELDNLTNILSSKPIVATLDSNGVAEYADPDTYKGLYLEGITDYVSGKPGHKLSQLIIQGGSLGYNSYTILNNLVEMKYGASENNTLSVNLKDVYWCPYTQVNYGESKLEGVDYYILTDHNTFTPYTDTSITNWNFNTLNGLIYTFDSSQNKALISNTNLLDNFITWYGNGSRQFSNTSDAGGVPTITGTIFIANANGTAINEDYFTSKYGVYYPNLTIYAEKVDTKNVTKYINILDSGKMEVIDVKRSAGDSPLFLTAEHPTKTNYDFKGWAFDEQGQDMFITYSEAEKSYESDYEAKLSNYSFEAHNTDVLRLYAIFTIHEHKFTYYNNDGTVLKTIYQPYNPRTSLIDPKIRPEKVTDEQLGTEEIYTWLGWTSSRTGQLTDLSNTPPIHDIDFTATYESEKSNVHDAQNVMDKKYFVYQYNDRNNPSAGCYVGLNSDYTIKGKVTVPNKIDDIYVTVLGSQYLNFYTAANSENNITHVFFDSTDCRVTTIDKYCFAGASQAQNDLNSKLKYVEPASSITTINEQAFIYCLIPFNSIYLLLNSSNMKNIGSDAFYRNTSPEALLLPGHDFDSIGDRAFGDLRRASELQIGSETDPCLWSLENLGENLFVSLAYGNQGRKVSRLHIYLPASKISDETYRNSLIAKFGFPTTYDMYVNDKNQPYAWIQTS